LREILKIGDPADMAQPSAINMTGPGAIDPRYKVVFGACLTQFTVIGLLFSYGLLFKIFETESLTVYRRAP